MKKLIFTLACLFALLSCQQKAKQTQDSGNDTDSLLHSSRSTLHSSRSTLHSSRSTLHSSRSYAEGFNVVEKEGWMLLEISDPQDDKDLSTYQFALVKEGMNPTDIPVDIPQIQVPVKSVICTTTLQLSPFLKLQALDVVSGVMSAKRLFSDDLKQRIEDGRIKKIGREGVFDVELIMAIQPSIIFVSPSKRGGFDQLAELGIPLVPYMGYQETSPLAQAEWIKLVGILLDREQEADSIFSVINKNYLAACSLVASDASQQKPSVLYGKMHGDNWYAMGGASFISRICRDASAHYFLSDDDRSGGVNLDFEDVYAKANDVDFWIVQSKGRDAITYETLGAEDERYVDFRPWKEHHVITCDMGNTPFNELSPMEPDTVLLDFIHAFHSNILKDYQPKYYKVL